VLGFLSMSSLIAGSKWRRGKQKYKEQC